MMQKVKLPREVAEALDQIKLKHKYPIRAVVEKFNSETIVPYPALTDYFEQDRSRRIETIMQALVNGYEVEYTPEEKVRLNYEVIMSEIGNSCSPSEVKFWDGVRNGVLRTLEHLNITIEGVNDDAKSD